MKKMGRIRQSFRQSFRQRLEHNVQEIGVLAQTPPKPGDSDEMTKKLNTAVSWVLKRSHKPFNHLSIWPVLIAFAFTLQTRTALHAATTIDAINKRAYGANIGWID